MRKFSLFLAVTLAACSSGVGIAQTSPTRKAETSPSQSPTSVRKPNAATSIRVSPDGSAPPLTNVFVGNVCSQTAGCENISSGQTETSLIHGGTYIDVYVWEVGYVDGETAKQGGNILGSTYLVGKYAFCESGGYYTTSCPVGSTYVGWLYEWDVAYYVENNFGELFAAQDTSAVYPYNTYSTSLIIQY